MVSVLLSESASLTSRETLTVLGGHGVTVDVVDSGRFTIGRFSRWCHRAVSVPPPGVDPIGYLTRIGDLAALHRYDAILPTHEQAWLFAAGRHLLPADVPIAVASIEAFDRVQGKLEFAELLDELAIPQPRWWRSDQEPADLPYPHWVKASHGTAGRSVRRVDNNAEKRAATRELAATGVAVMGQVPAEGQYGQVQALFDHGRMVAVHTSVQIGTGAGGSAAARLSVYHPEACRHMQTIGEHLAWHGGLTLDYFHVNGHPTFIECNPRTVEPGNAAAAGVNFPALTIALSRGQTISGLHTSRAGVRTRSALNLVVGAAEHGGRRNVAATLAGLLARRGELGHASEVLTPVLRDPPSALPLSFAAAQVLIKPTRSAALASGAVTSYSVTPGAVEHVRNARQ